MCIHEIRDKPQSKKEPSLLEYVCKMKSCSCWQHEKNHNHTEKIVIDVMAVGQTRELHAQGLRLLRCVVCAVSPGLVGGCCRGQRVWSGAAEASLVSINTD